MRQDASAVGPSQKWMRPHASAHWSTGTGATKGMITRQRGSSSACENDVCATYSYSSRRGQSRGDMVEVEDGCPSRDDVHVLAVFLPIKGRRPQVDRLFLGPLL